MTLFEFKFKRKPAGEAQLAVDNDAWSSDTKALQAARLSLECVAAADRSIWRALAFTSYAKVRDELYRLTALRPAPPQAAAAQQAVPSTAAPGQSTQPPPKQVAPTQPADESDRDAIIENVERNLCEAMQAMVPERERGLSPAKSYWTRLKLFYSGTRIEQAWSAIHRARATLYTLYPESELEPQIEGLAELIGDLPESNTARAALASALGKVKAGEKGTATLRSKRAELQKIYEQAIQVPEGLQRESRVLRNNLMIASAGIFFVLLALGLIHVFDKTVFSMCAGKTCPINGSEHPLDVFLVEAMGMLGGLLSVAIPLATGERIKTPYRVFNQQFALKVLAGAASAIAGVLLVSGGVVSLVTFKTSTALLGYALVFGFSQQIVTGAIDRRANTLAKETPSVKQV